MKDIVIFGASVYGKRAMYSLDDREYRVVAFIDNNKKKQGTRVAGIPVLAPEEIGRIAFDLVVISVAIYEEDMRIQLASLGVPNHKIAVYQPHSGGVFWQDFRYAILRACIDEIIRNNVEGNLAELGVYKGEFAQNLNKFMPDRKLYLFDTFEGFDVRDKHEYDNDMLNAHAFRDTSTTLVLSKMVKPENVIIRKGYFPETAAGLNERFCFVSLDADLYQPILNGLEYFYPRLEHGGYIFVHDFDSLIWTGVKAAVLDYCSKNRISYVPILDRGGSVIITK